MTFKKYYLKTTTCVYAVMLDVGLSGLCVTMELSALLCSLQSQAQRALHDLPELFLTASLWEVSEFGFQFLKGFGTLRIICTQSQL